MQSTSIQDFPLNSKRRLELQNQYNAQLLQQQQNCDDDMICDNEEPPFKKQRPGITANFLYKFVELAAYTSAYASDAINTITGNRGGKESRHIYDYDDDVLHVRTDEEDEENGSYNHKLDKKDESAWAENVDEEEPPPPYDSSWTMPSPSTHDKIEMKTLALSSSPSQIEFADSQPSTSQQIVTKSRRRQFRVRRGRRILRRKSSSTDMTASSQPEVDEDDIFLKFNCKLSGMINEGKAALTSKAHVTDVEMMIAEEKEREQRIMKEYGISSINRRARRHTSSSNSSDYDFYSSLAGSSSHSNKSTPSLFDSGFSYSSPISPIGHSIDNGFSTNSPIERSSPTQYGSPGFGGSFNGYGYGSPSTGSPTTSRYEGSSSDYNFGKNSSGYGSNMNYNNNNRSYY